MLRCQTLWSTWEAKIPSVNEQCRSGLPRNLPILGKFTLGFTGRGQGSRGPAGKDGLISGSAAFAYTRAFHSTSIILAAVRCQLEPKVFWEQLLFLDDQNYGGIQVQQPEVGESPDGGADGGALQEEQVNRGQGE